MAKPIHSVADFIDILESNTASRGHVQLFRGHDLSGLEPEPKVFRSSHMRNEHKSIREFVSAFPQEFDRDATTLEKLVRAQHFGIPTRLLDLTWNPLIALYFACSAQPNKDGEVFCYTVPKMRIKYYDSDTVSILSNLAYLSQMQKDDIQDVIDDLSRPGPVDLAKFNDADAVKKLIHFVRGEKPHFEPKINSDQLLSMYFVKPKLNNRRILAQSGAFAIYGLEVPTGTRRRFSVDRYIIPASQKKTISTTLELLNIHSSSVFPEVESAATYIQSKM